MERTLTVRLDAELDEELEQEAKRLRRSKGEVIREALRQRLKRPRPSAYDAFRKVVGIVKNGPPDLSTNKKYLADLGRRKR